MTLWRCFICGVDCECEHREIELMVWFHGVDKERQEAERHRLLDELRIGPKPELSIPFGKKQAV